MKNCTDIEQSKKLAELGIDEDTADMNYCNSSYKGKDYVGEWTLSLSSPKFAKTMLGMSVTDWNTCWEVIPAWSLSALLGLMPKLYEFENDPNDGGCQPNLCKGWDNNQWHIVYRSSIYITEWYDDPIDAAFEMVCWLKENKDREE